MIMVPGAPESPVGMLTQDGSPLMAMDTELKTVSKYKIPGQGTPLISFLGSTEVPIIPLSQLGLPFAASHSDAQVLRTLVMPTKTVLLSMRASTQFRLWFCNY